MSLIVAAALAVGFEGSIAGGYAFEASGSALPSARVGVGARAGLTYERLYLGGEITRQFGSSSSASRYDAHYSATYGGAEAGLDFRPWRLLLRPWIGGGVFVARGQTTVSQYVATDDHVYPFGAAGFLTAYTFHPWFVGLDLRAILVPAEGFRRSEFGGVAVFGVHLE
ncbi:MAG: hypothetical protein ACXVEF_39215 [Polyangiales bacterium]